MKKPFNFLTLAVLLLLNSFSAICQDEIQYKEYSYLEFLELLQAEKDTAFLLKNAIIKYTPSTDLSLFGLFVDKRKEGYSGIIKPKAFRVDTIVIDKRVQLENVHFTTVGETETIGSLSYLKFLRNVRIENSTSFFLSNCTFEKGLSISNLKEHQLPDLIKNQLLSSGMSVSESKVTGIFTLRIDQISNHRGISIVDNVFEDRPKDPFSRLLISIDATKHFDFSNNEIRNQDSRLDLEGVNSLDITQNHFQDLVTILLPNQLGERRSVSQNKFQKVASLNLGQLDSRYSITWPQFENKTVNGQNLRRRMSQLQANDSSAYKPLTNDLSADNLAYYQTEMIIQDELVYKEEVKLLGQFYEFYQSQHDRSYANSVFLKIKDLETARLEYLYNKTPSFETFFTWKINQFLSVFSAHGTKPAKAIVFSMYVILAFALVYLFFPNHWDSHGKNRIMDRYRFFLKYVNRDSGIHEVYLEEQKQDLLNAEDFKTYLLEQGKTAPKFFMATALPLYKWSVAGTRTFSWFLEKIDFLKGKWSETEPSKQSGKSVLLIAAFLIALTYDILIKMLNALMLSINTFTTLGFGEIPIKGLPRYLAIIQGFIGWFMLTIFSVSLISQLLN